MDALRETEMLKAKLELLKAAATSPAKRKRADPDIVLAPRSPKKARRDASPPRGALNTLEVEAQVEAGGADAGSEDRVFHAMRTELTHCSTRPHACAMHA